MARRKRVENAASIQTERHRQIFDLLGGTRLIGKYPANPLAAHDMRKRGLPNTAIEHLLDGLTTLAPKSIESAIGMSARTRQRREKHPTELLNRDQRSMWPIRDRFPIRIGCGPEFPSLDSKPTATGC